MSSPAYVEESSVRVPYWLDSRVYFMFPMICEILETIAQDYLGLTNIFKVKPSFCLNNPYLFIAYPQIQLMLCTLFPAFLVIFRASYVRVSRLPNCQKISSPHLLFVVLLFLSLS